MNMVSVTDTEEWTDIQKKLLTDHDFLTNTGKLLRSVPLKSRSRSFRNGINNRFSEEISIGD